MHSQIADNHYKYNRKRIHFISTKMIRKFLTVNAARAYRKILIIALQKRQFDFFSVMSLKSMNSEDDRTHKFFEGLSNHVRRIDNCYFFNTFCLKRQLIHHIVDYGIIQMRDLRFLRKVPMSKTFPNVLVVSCSLPRRWLMMLETNGGVLDSFLLKKWARRSLCILLSELRTKHSLSRL